MFIIMKPHQLVTVYTDNVSVFIIAISTNTTIAAETL